MMFGLDDPFFRPLWLRVALCALTFGWGLVELATGNPGFALMFLALGAFSG